MDIAILLLWPCLRRGSSSIESKASVSSDIESPETMHGYTARPVPQHWSFSFVNVEGLGPSLLLDSCSKGDADAFPYNAWLKDRASSSIMTPFSGRQ